MGLNIDFVIDPASVYEEETIRDVFNGITPTLRVDHTPVFDGSSADSMALNSSGNRVVASMINYEFWSMVHPVTVWAHGFVTVRDGNNRDAWHYTRVEIQREVTNQTLHSSGNRWGWGRVDAQTGPHPWPNRSYARVFFGW